MWDEPHLVLLRHPGDSPLLADSAHLGDVRLNHIEGPLLNPWRERLPPRKDLAPGDPDRRRSPQQHIVFQIVRRERLFKPVNFVLSQHLCCSQSPLLVLWPERIARARVYHQQRIRSHSLACRTHNPFIHRGGHAPEWTPTNFESPESLTS